MPEIEKIFKPNICYRVKSLTADLIKEFQSFRATVSDAKNLVKSLKKDETALSIYYLLQNNLLDFEIWMNNIEDLMKTMRKYVNELIELEKNFIKDNKKILTKFQPDQMQELVKVFQGHEKIASKRRNDINSMSELLYAELLKRRPPIAEIVRRLRDGETSPESLKKLLNDVSPLLSKPSKGMEEISKIVTWCVGHGNMSIYTDELTAFLKAQ